MAPPPATAGDRTSSRGAGGAGRGASGAREKDRGAGGAGAARGTSKGAGKAGGAAPAGGAAQAGGYLATVAVRALKAGPEDPSPRLLRLAPHQRGAGSSLLPPPPPKRGDDGGYPDDRFCTAGPTLEGPGGRRSVGDQPEEMAFCDLAERLESAMGQASLILSDRLQTLQRRMKGATLTATQRKELCSIADGISAAVYHVGKWAHAMQAKGETAISRPNRPSPCGDEEEASASLRYLIAKLTVISADAARGLAKAVKTHGDDAEAQVSKMGVPVEDLRSLAPHLEALIMRLGRLSQNIRPGPTMREFVPDYFAPKLGRKLAVRILPFLL